MKQSFACGRTWGWKPSAFARRGFSLFELIVVLVVLALVAGLTAPMVARSVGVGAERRAAGALATTLTVARLSAIQRGRRIEVGIVESAGAAVARWSAAGDGGGARESAIEPFPLRFEGGDTPTGGSAARVAFGPRGRAVLVTTGETPVPPAGRLTLRSRRSAGRLWLIEFDPVGGVPAVSMATGETPVPPVQ